MVHPISINDMRPIPPQIMSRIIITLLYDFHQDVSKQGQSCMLQNALFLNRWNRSNFDAKQGHTASSFET